MLRGKGKTMTEYIVQIEDSEKNISERFVGQLRSYPELIRCKDCKYSVDEYNDGECYCDYEKDLRYIKDWDHYCSRAERKDHD